MISDNVRAFSNQMEGLVKEHAASMRAVAQRWEETSAATSKGVAEEVGKAQKLVSRVRERAEFLKRQDQKGGVQEIGTLNEDAQYQDPDPAVERFSQGLVAQHRQQRQEQEPEPATTTPQSSDRNVQAGRASQDVPARPEPVRPPEASGWNVQVGRFGRRAEQQKHAPPQAPPSPPPKPEPRRQQPVYDDDDDFENQSWLR